MSAVDVDEAAFLARVERIAAAAPPLSPIASALLAAGLLGLVKDSRSFAQGFDLAHALVLRALTELGGAGFIEVTSRDPRSQRTAFILTEAGRNRAEI